MEYKKNIVLTATNSGGVQKGVLSYIKKPDGYHFEFRGINFAPKDRIMGVYIDDKLYKYDLPDRTLSFVLNLSKEYLDNVSVVVLSRDNMLTPFLWGSQLLTDDDYILNKVIEEVNIHSVRDTYSDNITDTFSHSENKDKTEKPFSFTENLMSPEEKFYTNIDRNNIIANEQKETEELIDKYFGETGSEDNEKGDDILPEFYGMISSQVEKMLNENETEKILEDIIPDSRFVNVRKPDGDSYVFGVIYENSIPKYICYGERGKFTEDRPEHLRAYYQWLPIDVSDLSGDGYFMMYQDAQTGKNLEMTVI